MKLLKYLPFALAIAIMPGCSNDNFTEESNREILDDGGYVSVNIHLPSLTGKTRMTTVGELSDGISQEYAVSNGTIILFDASADPEVITNQAYTNTELGFSMSGADNITSTSTKVMIPSGTSPKYILVFLNRPDGYGDAITAIKAGDKYSDIAKVYATTGTELSAISAIGNYHFMSNSVFDNYNLPVASFYPVNTATSQIQNLQQINPSSVANSKTSVTSTSTNVYVERASIKVDLAFNLAGQNTTTPATVTPGTNGMPIITYTASGDVLTVTGWVLTVRNKSYYPVKNIIQSNWNSWLDGTKYYMADDINGNANFRSYWAMDPAYITGPTADTNQGFFTEFTYAPYSATVSAIGVDNPQYCLENTFTAANQNQNQTTAVLISAQYKLNGGATGDNVYLMGNTLYNGSDFIAALVAKMNMLSYTNGGNTLVADDFTLVVKSASANNNIYKNIVEYTGSGNLMLGSTIIIDNSIAGASVTGMDTILESFGHRSVVYYDKGRCYYSIPIRHFTDTEVPLYDGSGYATLNGVSGINAQHQEGRYGVVRNHWYSVNVNSIKQIGRPAPVNPGEPINPDPSYPDPTDPEPVDPTPTPDDVENLYIDAQINILPWAKRAQNADV